MLPFGKAFEYLGAPSTMPSLAVAALGLNLCDVVFLHAVAARVDGLIATDLSCFKPSRTVMVGAAHVSMAVNNPGLRLVQTSNISCEPMLLPTV